MVRTNLYPPLTKTFRRASGSFIYGTGIFVLFSPKWRLNLNILFCFDRIFWLFCPFPSTSWVQRFIGLCSTKHHITITWRTAASTRPQILLVDSICGPPAANSCLYRDTGIRCSVVGLKYNFLWPATSLTRCQTVCEIRTLLWQLFSSGLEHFSFLVLLAYIALRLCGIQKFGSIKNHLAVKVVVVDSKW